MQEMLSYHHCLARLCDPSIVWLSGVNNANTGFSPGLNISRSQHHHSAVYEISKKSTTQRYFLIQNLWSKEFENMRDNIL